MRTRSLRDMVRLVLLREEFIDAADGPEHLGLGHLMVVHRGPVIDPGPGHEGVGIDDVGGGPTLSLYRSSLRRRFSSPWVTAVSVVLIRSTVSLIFR